MRKVETMMNVAIQAGKPLSRQNTVVQHEDGVAYVYLHGNKICEIGEDWLKLYDGGWQSNTTKSRLNAILEQFGVDNERVYAKNFTWYVGTPNASVPFESGMILR